MQRHSTAVCAAFVAACAAVGFSACDVARPATEEKPRPDAGAVEVLVHDGAALRRLARASLTPEQWHRILAVYVHDSASSIENALPMLGSYTVHDRAIRFTPRFTPIAGAPYIVRYDGPALQQQFAGDPGDDWKLTIDTTVLIPVRTASVATRVVQIYPAVDTVPMNLLRMYVHFSAPMSIGEAYERIHLLDAHGEEVKDAFLVVKQELWDPERTRFTLLFDPGRIKRGLRPNEELGLPLRQGLAYTLVVDSAWQDANGSSLAGRFVKQMLVAAPDRSAPRPADWKLNSPQDRAALTVDFPEPLDRALLERLLIVKHADGKVVSGSIEVAQGERQWRFTPHSPWSHGDYSLEIGTDLEDLAGNNLRDVFDVDRSNPQPTGITGPRIALPFRIE